MRVRSRNNRNEQGLYSKGHVRKCLGPTSCQAALGRGTMPLQNRDRDQNPNRTVRPKAEAVALAFTISQKTVPTGITVSNAHDIVAPGVHNRCGRGVRPQA
jgi:hypothetical protein